MEKKKKKKGLKVLIVLLILILLGVAGYICYDKGIIKLPVKETEEKKPKDTKYDNKLSQGEIDDLTDIAKEISNNFASYYPLTTLSIIENQDLLYWGLKRIGLKELITEKEMETEIRNYFGDIQITHEDIECPTSDDEPLYLHENGGYVPNPNHFGHGGYTKPGAALYYVSSLKEGNEIMINFKILYSNSCSDTCILSAYYRNYEDAIKGHNPVLEGDPDSEDGPGVNLTDEEYNKVEVMLPVTSFTFTKTDTGYILKKVKINE